MASLVDRPVELIHVDGFTMDQGKAFSREDSVEHQRQDILANSRAARLTLVKYADGRITAKAYGKARDIHNGPSSETHQEGIHHSEHDCQRAGEEPRACQTASGIPLDIGCAAEHQNTPEQVAGSRLSTQSSGTGAAHEHDIPIQSYRTREPGDEYFDFNERIGEEDQGGAGVGGGDGDDGFDTETEIVSDSDSEDDDDSARWAGIPTRDGIPLIWDRHHDLLTWSFRGPVREIKSNLQFLFNFRPQLSDEFLLGRLNGRFAEMHLEFLLRHLPGETGTIQQARDRRALYERGSTDDDEVIRGQQTIQIQPRGYGDPEYQAPPMPGNAPVDWARRHDAMLNTYMTRNPREFLEDCGDFLTHGACLEFLQIRLAQTIHLGITLNELQEAIRIVHQSTALQNRVTWGIV